jgi:hypothetical protein
MRRAPTVSPESTCARSIVPGLLLVNHLFGMQTVAGVCGQEGGPGMPARSVGDQQRTKRQLMLHQPQAS